MALPRRNRKPARSLERQGRVRVEGLRELHKKLKKLDRETRGEALTGALLAAARPIEEEWSNLAPRSDIPGGSRGKGHAADHIRSEVQESTGKHTAEAHVGPEKPFWYLVFDEFGVNWGNKFQPANAPGRRAADAKFKEAVVKFRDELRDEIERAVRG